MESGSYPLPHSKALRADFWDLSAIARLPGSDVPVSSYLIAVCYVVAVENQGEVD